MNNIAWTYTTENGTLLNLHQPLQTVDNNLPVHLGESIINFVQSFNTYSAVSIDIREFIMSQNINFVYLKIHILSVYKNLSKYIILVGQQATSNHRQNKISLITIETTTGDVCIVSIDNGCTLVEGNIRGLNFIHHNRGLDQHISFTYDMLENIQRAIIMVKKQFVVNDSFQSQQVNLIGQMSNLGITQSSSLPLFPIFPTRLPTQIVPQPTAPLTNINPNTPMFPQISIPNHTALGMNNLERNTEPTTNSNSTSDREIIVLKCEKDGRKLRIRVYGNSNYHQNVNCQFPRDIRREGQYYTIEGPLGVSRTTRSIFYRASNKKTIKMISELEAQQLITGNKQEKIRLNIYHSDTDECIICMSNNKDVIFDPCGHYYCCQSCYNQLPTKKCPICRSNINNVIKDTEISSGCDDD